ncbi:MAG TPA: Tat pathway signal protein [Acidobacteriaceae bacterium]|nr:Tat pathway signal protein [Acidobacteriaceae bacterium]
MAAGTAALHGLAALAEEPGAQAIPHALLRGTLAAGETSVEGHTLLSTFARGSETWKVYEDLRTRDGAITYVSSTGHARVLPKNAEAVFAEEGPQYLGLDLAKIGMAPNDLLADKLLAQGDPDEDEVRRAAPPMDSAEHGGRGFRPRWNTIVGTRECSDTMPVYPAGNTRTYHPGQYFPEMNQEKARKRHEGLAGGWMPAVRKVLPGDEGSYFETIVFGDVLARDRFIVQTWHRTAHVQDGKILKVVYGYSYPAYTRRRQDPDAEEFYRALLEFAEYWDRVMHDMTPLTLPDASWSNMARYAFVKEQVVRPGGVYPKYGAVDRDYYGPEYDGFQDIFTMALYANLEWGRFAEAHDIFDNYFTSFVDAKGMINMRGPETAQFGLTLSLIARYYHYTRDAALLTKHREKIEATATLLAELHEEALQLPETDPGHGLIHGWSESDSCLTLDPSIWWKPYFSNSAFTVRGWRDLAPVWRKLDVPGGTALAEGWSRRGNQLQAALVKSIDANTKRDQQPAYIGPLPGAKLTFRESLEKEHPSEQGWVHRCYAELLQPGVLTDEQTNTVIDCMRAYGATTLGVVANVERPHPEGRDILGFISYGYAQALLRLDRIEEYLLFLYAHRYHDHSRGSWTAGEVSGITGDDALFCIPAQQTIPLLVRWMLVFEDPDAERLYFGRGLPRRWVGSGKPIGIEQAPTRWGRVNYELAPESNKKLTATITLPENGNLPRELQVTFRVPEGRSLQGLQVNGKSVAPGGRKSDSAIFPTAGERRFSVVATLI